MADPIHGLTTRAANQVGQVVRKVLRTLPDTGRRTRRVVGNSSGNSNAGSTGSTGCCCNSMNCVRLCDLTVADVVTECDECPSGATKKYTVTFGSGWISGNAILTHVDGGCTWESATFSITISGITGTYKWVLVQAGSASTLTLTWVSGDDPVQACAGYATTVTIVYTATTTQGQAWSCLCNSKMQLTTDRTTIPTGSGLEGEVCVVPQSVAGTPTDGCVVDAEAVCYEMIVAGVSGPACVSQYNKTYNIVSLGTCSCFVSPVEVTTSPARSLGTMSPDCTCGAETTTADRWWFNYLGPGVTPTLVFGPAYSGDSCSPTGYVSYNLISGTPLTDDDLVFEFSGSYLNHRCTLGGSFDNGGYTTWPTTLTMTRNADCSYTAANCDCLGGESDVAPGCADTCTWIGVDSGGGVIVWNSTGGTGIDGCDSCGGCNQPGHTPSLGETATTGCIDA